MMWLNMIWIQFGIHSFKIVMLKHDMLDQANITEAADVELQFHRFGQMTIDREDRNLTTLFVVYAN
ncbi:hypothetical protein D3C85_1456300 [compost metagenome]